MEARERESIQRDLASADDELRRLAVERLALLPAAEVIPELIARLGDPSWRVRKAAVERLAASPEPGRACDSLLAALADGENPGRRNAALEALAEDGRLEISSQLDDGRNGRFARVTVRDNGPGFDEQVRRHLFDPFFSGRAAGRGLGMGLAKCWWIVQMHEGSIEVESQASKGATFSIALPMSAPQAGPHRAPKRSAHRRNGAA